MVHLLGLLLFLTGCADLWVSTEDLCPEGRVHVYEDKDQDGYGDPDHSLGCEVPISGPWSLSTDDCDDDDAEAWPGAEEVCDGADNDCDGETDEGLTILYGDADGDGHGDPYNVLGCAIPDDIGFVTNTTDCDDSDGTVYPEAPERCDTLDNDCDGETDEDLELYYADVDDDGHGDPDQPLGCDCGDMGCVPSSADLDDCDDSFETVYNGAAELCDALDNDCDDETDEGLDTWYADLDEDGHGDPEGFLGCTAPETGGYVHGDEDIDDCDDALATVYLDAEEVCDDVDNDCDEEIDEDLPYYYQDADADGHGDPATPLGCYVSSLYAESEDGTDCDDTSARRYPGLVETCDETDNDCDGYVDEELDTYYLDLDADGHGDPAAYQGCTLPVETYVTSSDPYDDCDDGRAEVNPDQVEVCDDLDNDCSGEADDGLTVYYADADADGYGDIALGCAPSEAVASVAVDGDCDDADAESFPGNPEVCDEADNDCNSSADDGASDALTWYYDGDGDGVGQAADSVESCEADGEYRALVVEDADDDNPSFAADAPWVDVAFGENNACAVRSDGSVACWGNNVNGTADASSAPGDAVAIALTYKTACALRAGGTLGCWGNTTTGTSRMTGVTAVDGARDQICGLDATGLTCTTNPLRVSGAGYASLAAGPDYACYTTTAGKAGCVDRSGALSWASFSGSAYTAIAAAADDDVACALDSSGDLSCVSSGSFALSLTDGDVLAMDVGYKDVCVVRTSGAVDCWALDTGDENTALSGAADGDNADAVELVVGTEAACARAESGVLSCFSGEGLLRDIDVPTTATLSLTARDDFTCSVRDGAVDCWGDVVDDFAATPRFVDLECGYLCMATSDDGRPWITYKHTAGWEFTRDTAPDDDYVGVLHDLDDGIRCGLAASGRVDCWGGGLDYDDDSYADYDDFIQIDMGWHSGCGVRSGGEVVCWGDTTDGDAVTSDPTLSTDAVQVEVYIDTACALLANGTVECWAPSTGVVTLNDMTLDLTVGYGWACGLGLDGAVQCGAFSSYTAPVSFSLGVEILDLFVLASSTSPTLGVTIEGGVLTCGATSCAGVALTPEDPHATILSASYATYAARTCGLFDDGEVVCSSSTGIDTNIGSLESLTAGGGHVCLLDNGDLFCSGADDEGQSSVPDGAFGQELARVTAGDAHTCALLEDGTGLCWGDDADGQATLPEDLEGVDLTAISAGARHSCAIDSDGLVSCWGDDDDGQCDVPAALDDGVALDVAAGPSATCAVVDMDPSDGLDQGEVRCWGAALDEGTIVEAPVDLQDATAVAVGGGHVCVIREDADEPVTCWGADEHGQSSDAPPISLVELALGDEHSCGLTAAGAVLCWGSNDDGQTEVPAF